MSKYRINKPIAALYTAIATGILGGGGAWAYTETRENQRLADVWEEINYLRPVTQSIDGSGVLPEQIGTIIPLPLDWSADYELRGAERSPDDPELVCAALNDMQTMHRYYLNKIFAKNPKIIASTVKDTAEYRRIVTDTSPAEQALCLNR